MAFQFSQTGQELQYLADEVTQLAGDYDETASYAIGDYCNYQGTVYRCTAATTGTFDAADWTSSVIVMDAIKSLKARMTTAEGDIAQALGMRLVTYSLVMRTAVTGTQTLTTYSGRKFSDYPLVLITIGVGTDVRASTILPTSVFDDGAAVILTVLHGSNSATVTTWSVSSASIKYLSDTSIEVTIAGSGVANSVAVYGITLAN